MYRAATTHAGSLQWVTPLCSTEEAISEALLTFAIEHPGAYAVVLIADSERELEVMRNDLMACCRVTGSMPLTRRCFIPPQIAYVADWAQQARMWYEFSRPLGDHDIPYVYEIPPVDLANRLVNLQLHETEDVC